MQKETKQQRAERKSIWIAKATVHFDSPELRKEASDMFEKANPIPTSKSPNLIEKSKCCINCVRNKKQLRPMFDCEHCPCHTPQEEKSKCGCRCEFCWNTTENNGRNTHCGSEIYRCPFTPQPSIPNYSHLSHTHCWNNKKNPCGIKLENHSQCCLCDLKYMPIPNYIESVLKEFDEKFERYFFNYVSLPEYEKIPIEFRKRKLDMWDEYKSFLSTALEKQQKQFIEKIEKLDDKCPPRESDDYDDGLLHMKTQILSLLKE